MLILAVVAGTFIADAAVQAGPASAPATGCAAGLNCGQGTDSGAATSGAARAPQSCIQQAACGGGAALALGGIVLVAVLVGSNDLVPDASTRRTIRLEISSIVDRLAAGRLFRPPRPSF
jgi:hypothetical protein